MPFRRCSATIGTPKPGGKLRQYRIALVVGTRPEAIKLSPIVHALAVTGEQPGLFVTGQHPGLELADHGLEKFPTVLIGCPGQPDPMLHADLVRAALKRALAANRPELVIVQGDTSSALGGALAASELGIALAHVEAGLRTYDPNLPWPEEENRVAIDKLSSLLFAPTNGNAANLRREQLPGRIHVTGNSGIDALMRMTGSLPSKAKRRWLPRQHFKLLVTCHRRENWEAGLEGVATALRKLVEHRVAVDVILPPNPGVTERMHYLLGGRQGIALIPPLSHAATIAAMRSADLVLSDSGGMQEEAPALGVPLLVLRDKTERPEGLATGTTELVGTEPERIVNSVNRLRHDRRLLRQMSRPCLPFGDGNAASRIADHCLSYVEEMEAARKRRRA